MPTLPSTPRCRDARSRRGFSLVEVVLAIGIVAFSFLAILSLIPAGLGQFRKAMDISVCTQIAQRIISDAQQTDFNTLVDTADLTPPLPAGYSFQAPSVNNHWLRYFNDEGNEIVPVTPGQPTPADLAKALYWVNVRIAPQTAFPNAGGAGAVVLSPSVATLTIDIANNPGGLPIKITSDNRFSATPGVAIYTYFAYIGAN